jgi:hypothetical protein
MRTKSVALVLPKQKIPVSKRRSQLSAATLAREMAELIALREKVRKAERRLGLAAARD